MKVYQQQQQHLAELIHLFCANVVSVLEQFIQIVNHL